MIVQHHERHDGRGYPAQMKGIKIFDLAKILTIANEFDNKVSEFSEKNPETMYKKAIRWLEQGSGSYFDPKKCAKCVKILDHAFKPR